MKYSVNYKVSFGIDVTQEEIDKIKKHLTDKKQTQYMIWNIALTKDSSDKEIAEFIGLENQNIAESVDLEMDEIYEY